MALQVHHFSGDTSVLAVSSTEIIKTMNTRQRRRHIILWTLLTILVIILSLAARMNIPQFAGDTLFYSL